MAFGASMDEDSCRASDYGNHDSRHSSQRGDGREVTLSSRIPVGMDAYASGNSSNVSRHSSQRGDATDPTLAGMPMQNDQDCWSQASDDANSDLRHSSQRGDTREVTFSSGNPAGMGSNASENSSTASRHSSQHDDMSGVLFGDDHVRAMYRTSNSTYSGTWKRTQGALGSRAVPTVDSTAEHHPAHPDTFYRTTNQEYCGNRPRVSRAVRNRPFVNNAKTMLNGLGSAPTYGNGFKVISAGVPSKPFPAEASSFVNPKSSRRGADNLLYQTSSQAIGSSQVEDEHIPDRYFPSNNNFTTSFVDKKPRYTGLNTNPSRSKVHRSLDECY